MWRSPGGTLYEGPPINVVWDVTESTTVRSPFSGYVEFTTRERFDLPEKERDARPEYYLLMSSKFGPVRHRYEFDLMPNHLELARMLQRSGHQTDWVDEVPGELCWQRIATGKEQKSDDKQIQPK